MLLSKDIIQDGHDTLRQVAKEVELPLSAKDKLTAIELIGYVINSQNEEVANRHNLRGAVGLAAPQINVSKRMFAIAADDGKKMETMVVINPVITQKSKEMTYLETGEGCLSFDDNVTGLVRRHKSIKVEAHLLDLKTGNTVKKSFKLSGFHAIVFQHEYDHLDGILFADKVEDEITDIKPFEF